MILRLSVLTKLTLIVALTAILWFPSIMVVVGPSELVTVNAANNGDTVLVGPGTYVENINFNGKAILANGAFRSIYSPGAVS